ncbi:MAG: 1-deoxy-D-xylulose-5-phosphate synthase N-terminal domain-containing protein [Candidatus Magasanikbacteria bacterium]|jgi:transketolase
MIYNLLEKKDLAKLKKEQPERFELCKFKSQYLNLQKLELSEPKWFDKERLSSLARLMRALIFAAVEAGQSGHPGGSSSKVEQILALLLGENLAYDPTDPKNSGRDRLIWSAGHCTPALHSINSLIYECLRRAGRKFSPTEIHAVFPENLTRFRHADGPQGHVESQYPLADTSTGPSGHGLSAAGGIAIAHKSCGLDTKVFVLMGDAESEEGMSYEARNVISTTNTDNLIVSLDYNHFGIDGPIEEAMNSPYINHWLGMGWNVIEVDGENILELFYAYRLAAEGFGNNLPTAVIAHTLKGKLYGSMENTATSHGTPAKHDEYVTIMKNLGFEIPGIAGQVIKDIEYICGKITKDDEKFLLSRLDLATKKLKTESELIKKMVTALPDRPLVNPVSLRRPETLPPELIFKGGEQIATRKASAAWFKWLMQKTAFFYAGAGDLGKSILVNQAENIYGLINQTNPYGRGIRFGIAEQNMAMMYAAMSQDVLPGGFQPVSVFGTYAVFTTMIGNCVRLALIGNHLKPDSKGFFIVLAAHDGPETGEDGPTHQGLYWMSLYNALPGIKVYKPFDANETVEMLFYALEKGEPIALSVTRPDTPVIKREGNVPPARAAINGAYVYKPFANNKKQKTVLAICGSQMLFNTLEILPNLEKDFDVKILAVTSPELFEEYRKKDPRGAQEIFPDSERELVVALHNGWKGFLYPFLLPADYDARSIAIETYLKSGNVPEVYEVAHLTPREIEEKILKAVKNKTKIL